MNRRIARVLAVTAMMLGSLVYFPPILDASSAGSQIAQTWADGGGEEPDQTWAD